MRQGEKTAVGLDIGDRQLRLVQLRAGAGEGEWRRHYVEELPPGLVEGGVIRDREALLPRLQSAVRRLELKHQPTVTAIPAAQLYSRTLKLPLMPLPELRAAARLQALAFLPLPLEETVSDIVPGPPREEDGFTFQEVFFVALRRTQVATLDYLCARAGLKLRAVETEADALHRLLAAEAPCDPVVLLYTEPGRALLAAYEAGRPRFIRPLHAEPGGAHRREALTPRGLRPELNRALSDLERQHGLRPDRVTLCGRAEHNQAYTETVAAAIRGTVALLDTAKLALAGPAPPAEEAGALLLALGLARRLLR